MNPEQFGYNHYVTENGDIYSVSQEQIKKLFKPIDPAVLAKLMDAGKPSDEEMARQVEEIDRALAPKFHFKGF